MKLKLLTMVIVAPLLLVAAWVSSWKSVKTIGQEVLVREFGCPDPLLWKSNQIAGSTRRFSELLGRGYTEVVMAATISPEELRELRSRIAQFKARYADPDSSAPRVYELLDSSYLGGGLGSNLAPWWQPWSVPRGDYYRMEISNRRGGFFAEFFVSSQNTNALVFVRVQRGS